MTQTPTEKVNMAIVRKFFEVGPSKGDHCSGRCTACTRIFPAYSPADTGPGIEAINNVITTCRAAFHGLNVTIDDMMADGDKVTCRFTARGVQTGSLWASHRPANR